MHSSMHMSSTKKAAVSKDEINAQVCTQENTSVYEKVVITDGDSDN